MTDAWIPLEEFIQQQVEVGLAELDAFIDSHDDAEERKAMERQRPQAAAKIEAIVRMVYMQEPNA